MKLNHLIIIGALCGALLIPSSASSWGVVGLSAGGGGLTTAYIGWSTDGATTDTPTSASTVASGNERTDVNMWEPSVSGTAKRIRYYFGESNYITADNVTMCIYKGTTLVGTGDITPAATSWVWSSDLVAESGQTLTFTADDDIRFGISINNAGVNGFNMTYGGGVVGNKDRHDSAYLPNPATWADISTATAGAILEYEY